MNLSEMTVTQLREIAADLDIFGRSKMKKADLIAAIEFAEAPSVDNIPGGVDTFADTFDHTAAVAKMRANIDAEEEKKAAARRARNRTNYAPAPDAKPAVNEVAILRDAPGAAIITAAFDGRTVAGQIVRRGNRLMLVAGTIKITGSSFEKVAKRFAQRLGFRADVIDVARAF